VLAGYFSKLFLSLLQLKTKEVQRYLYTHPLAIDHMVRHLGQKSVSEVLQKVLNLSEPIASGKDLEDEVPSSVIDGLRQSFVYKVVQRVVNDAETDVEVFLNGISVLQELVFVKVINQELTSARCIQLYRDCLGTQASSLAK
jgi:hypothetical protein